MLISHTFTWCLSIFSPSILAYCPGCKGRNGAPKQALKVGLGSVTPSSVPATLAVYPEINWYMACAAVNLETGGSTPNASQVSKNMFLGIQPTEGYWSLLINDKG